MRVVDEIVNAIASYDPAQIGISAANGESPRAVVLGTGSRPMTASVHDLALDLAASRELLQRCAAALDHIIKHTVGGPDKRKRDGTFREHCLYCGRWEDEVHEEGCCVKVATPVLAAVRAFLAGTEEPCPDCQGRGWYAAVDPKHPHGEPIQEQCSRCYGGGKGES